VSPGDAKEIAMPKWAVAEEFDTGDGVVRWTSFGQGEPVVLLHGTPFSSFIWRDIAPALATARTVFVWDMLGFGQSDKHEGQDVSFAAQARVFSGLLRHWNLNEPSVVAHDIGGAVALRAILAEGARYRDITLMDAVGVDGWGPRGFFQVIQENPDVFAELPDWATEALIASKIRTGSHLGLRAGVLEAYLDSWRGAEGRAAFFRQYAQAEDTDEIQDRVADLPTPIRIVWGREDRWLSLDYAERLRARLPDAEFTVIEDAGHAVQEDAPGQLTSYLMRALVYPEMPKISESG
jgi:pimeloyl-ACP methyl ester carboxylesterase